MSVVAGCCQVRVAVTIPGRRARPVRALLDSARRGARRCCSVRNLRTTGPSPMGVRHRSQRDWAADPGVVPAGKRDGAGRRRSRGVEKVSDSSGTHGPSYAPVRWFPLRPGLLAGVTNSSQRANGVVAPLDDDRHRCHVRRPLPRVVDVRHAERPVVVDGRRAGFASPLRGRLGQTALADARPVTSPPADLEWRASPRESDNRPIRSTLTPVAPPTGE